MALKVYGIKNCDTIKKTLQWLDAERVEHTFIDLKKIPPTEDQVTDWLAELGDALVNTKSSSFRNLSDETKANFTGSVRSGAILKKPFLIKRPLLVNGKILTSGFDPEKWKKIPNLLVN